ncbi:MAG TPA: TetR/AcrR family transcriptional regulator [Fimbriimonadaceae bacterium]|nr:TetR/AcrR family transcriptional regulator [Fimbriimonadaceae bacterium]
MSQKVKVRKQLDPAKTRASILKAAFKLFAERGYKGASIADIAHAAQVRKSLIQYHFGTKEELWNACIESRAAPMIAAIDRMLAKPDPSLGELLATRYKFLRDNPEVRKLLGWASMGSIPVPPFLMEKRKQLIGSFAGEMNPKQLARMLFALSATDGWFHFRNLYAVVAGEEAKSPAVEEEFLKILAEVAPKHE